MSAQLGGFLANSASSSASSNSGKSHLLLFTLDRQPKMPQFSKYLLNSHTRVIRSNRPRGREIDEKARRGEKSEMQDATNREEGGRCEKRKDETIIRREMEKAKARIRETTEPYKSTPQHACNRVDDFFSSTGTNTTVTMGPSSEACPRVSCACP